MKLLIRDGSLYADSFFLCHVEAGHGRTHLPNGIFEVTISFSHAHQEELPQAHGIGWIGYAPDKHDLILGAVRGRDSLLPSRAHVGRIQALIEQSLEDGKPVTLEVWA